MFASRNGRILGLGVVLGILPCAGPARSAQSSADWTAPRAAEHVVPRLDRLTGTVFSNLLYEGNNRAMRGAFDPRPEKGCQDAQKWSELAARVAGLFVLRDALYSQQDHPLEHRACALMMPSNWVTAAVHATIEGIPLRPVEAPDLHDDAAWGAVESAAEMFGSFQASASLFRWATRAHDGASPREQARIRNARHAVASLARDARELVMASEAGPLEVARVGAERIARSDRAYFGAEIRRDHVIVLMVENPNRMEVVRERKGVEVHGRWLRPEALALARETIYARRLRDGPIALERYDITHRDDLDRLVAMLEVLVPQGSQGHPVYVWVGGPAVVGTKRVRSALHALPHLLERLRTEAIETSRVVVFARPVFQARGAAPTDLRAFIDRMRAHDALAGVNMRGDVLRRWMGWSR